VGEIEILPSTRSYPPPHIDILHYFTGEQLLCNSFILIYVPTKENTAYLMLKDLPSIVLYTYLNSIVLTKWKSSLVGNEREYCAICSVPSHNVISLLSHYIFILSISYYHWYFCYDILSLISPSISILRIQQHVLYAAYAVPLYLYVCYTNQTMLYHGHYFPHCLTCRLTYIFTFLLWIPLYYIHFHLVSYHQRSYPHLMYLDQPNPSTFR